VRSIDEHRASDLSKQLPGSGAIQAVSDLSGSVAVTHEQIRAAPFKRFEEPRDIRSALPGRVELPNHEGIGRYSECLRNVCRRSNIAGQSQNNHTRIYSTRFRSAVQTAPKWAPVLNRGANFAVRYVHVSHAAYLIHNCCKFELAVVTIVSMRNPFSGTHFIMEHDCKTDTAVVITFSI
jgi:hypothetical protein